MALQVIQGNLVMVTIMLLISCSEVFLNNIPSPKHHQHRHHSIHKRQTPPSSPNMVTQQQDVVKQQMEDQSPVRPRLLSQEPLPPALQLPPVTQQIPFVFQQPTSKQLSFPPPDQLQGTTTPLFSPATQQQPVVQNQQPPSQVPPTFPTSEGQQHILPPPLNPESLEKSSSTVPFPPPLSQRVDQQVPMSLPPQSQQWAMSPTDTKGQIVPSPLSGGSVNQDPSLHTTMPFSQQLRQPEPTPSSTISTAQGQFVPIPPSRESIEKGPFPVPPPLNTQQRMGQQVATSLPPQSQQWVMRPREDTKGQIAPSPTSGELSNQGSPFPIPSSFSQQLRQSELMPPPLPSSKPSISFTIQGQIPPSSKPSDQVPMKGKSDQFGPMLPSSLSEQPSRLRREAEGQAAPLPPDQFISRSFFPPTLPTPTAGQMLSPSTNQLSNQIPPISSNQQAQSIQGLLPPLSPQPSIPDQGSPLQQQRGGPIPAPGMADSLSPSASIQPIVIPPSAPMGQRQQENGSDSSVINPRILDPSFTGIPLSMPRPPPVMPSPMDNVPSLAGSFQNDQPPPLPPSPFLSFLQPITPVAPSRYHSMS